MKYNSIFSKKNNIITEGPIWNTIVGKAHSLANLAYPLSLIFGAGISGIKFYFVAKELMDHMQKETNRKKMELEEKIKSNPREINDPETIQEKKDIIENEVLLRELRTYIYQINKYKKNGLVPPKEIIENLENIMIKIRQKHPELFQKIMSGQLILQ